jgi:hypothetical protein
MPQVCQRQLVVAPNALRSLGRSLTAITIAFGITVGFHNSAEATLYDWSYTDLGASGSGTLTTGGPSGGGSLITGITGTFDGGAITGLGGGFFADDLLFSPSPLLDFDGLAFHATIMGVPTTVELFYVNQQQSFSSQAGYGFTTYPKSLEFCNDPDSCSSAGMRIEGIDIFARLDSGLSGQFDVVAATPLPGALPLMGTVLGAAYFISRRRKRRAVG